MYEPSLLLDHGHEVVKDIMKGVLQPTTLGAWFDLLTLLLHVINLGCA